MELGPKVHTREGLKIHACVTDSYPAIFQEKSTKNSKLEFLRKILQKIILEKLAQRCMYHYFIQKNAHIYKIISSLIYT